MHVSMSHVNMQAGKHVSIFACKDERHLLLHDVVLSGGSDPYGMAPCRGSNLMA
jgi:hypothetical protein